MFGHVQANLNDLTQEEKERYRAAYCGLCHTLGDKYGLKARMGLTYDLTFLSLLLSSLYEPAETGGNSRCIVHPCKKHPYIVNSCTEYAADMTVALVYHKCLDDWKDERKKTRKWYASLLEESYQKVKGKWPEQCNGIELQIAELSKIESDDSLPPDMAINCCGYLMESIFTYQHDFWEKDLRKLGFGLGRFIYFADAVIDYEKDCKAGAYNPLKKLHMSPEETRSTLKSLLGDSSQAFEKLPLVQDAGLLKNILYSGIWIKYNHELNSGRTDDKNG